MAYDANEARYDTMAYARAGKSGLMLPRVSLGLWHNFGEKDEYGNMRAVCRAAFDAGVTHFDLANNYGPCPGEAETNFGRILRDDLLPYRDELIISTKAGYRMWPGPYGDGGSRKYLLASLDASLKRMGLSYVDIFYHHRMDGNTPLEESMLALSAAVRSGRALYAGISNYDAATAARAAAILAELRCPFVLDQVRYSLFDRHIEADALPDAAEKSGFGLIAFSPLAQGLLSMKYVDGIPADSRAGKGVVFLRPAQVTEERVRQARALNEVAAARGQTLPQMALSWVLREPRVASVLVGASRPAQIRENVAAANAPAFTADELAEIERIAPA